MSAPKAPEETAAMAVAAMEDVLDFTLEREARLVRETGSPASHMTMRMLVLMVHERLEREQFAPLVGPEIMRLTREALARYVDAMPIVGVPEPGSGRGAAA